MNILNDLANNVPKYDYFIHLNTWTSVANIMTSLSLFVFSNIVKHPTKWRKKNLHHPSSEEEHEITNYIIQVWP